MRKIVLAISFSLSTLICCAQYPALLNNTKWYTGSSCQWGTFLDWYYPTNDTVINTSTYKKYNRTNSTQQIIIREDTLQRKVWININSQDELLYDFNLSLGDTGVFFQINFTVTSEDSVNSCFGLRRRIHFDPIPGQPGQPEPFDCIEGIGSLFNPFEVFAVHYFSDICYYHLICSYQNDTVTYVNPNSNANCPNDCSILTSINNERELNFSYSLYPNPANNLLTIEGKSIVTNKELASIYDLTDKLLMQFSLTGEKTTIDISSLTPGIYFLSLYDGEQTLQRKFAKQ